MEQDYGHSSLELKMIQRAEERRFPLSGSMELLPLCNMNCDMCYVRLSRQEMDQQGRIRSLAEWLRLAKEMQETGVLFLLLTGGEPLLYPDFKELYLELKKMGFILTVNTNGTLIDAEWAAFFGQNKPRRMNVTLYGAEEDTYRRLCHYSEGYEKTIRGIQLLKEQGVDVKISVSAVEANKKDLDRILALGDELDSPVNIDCYMMPATRERGSEYCYSSRMDPVEAARIAKKVHRAEIGGERYENYRNTMLEIIDRIQPETEPAPMGCHAGKSSFSINWQGQLQPCVMMKEPGASVFEIGFAAAWNQVQMEADRIRLSSKCSGCRLRPLCRNCAACARLEAGSYDGVPEYMCRYTEEVYRLLKEENG